MKLFMLFFVFLSFVHAKGFYGEKLKSCDSMYSEYRDDYIRINQDHYKNYSMSDKNHPCSKINELNTYEKALIYEKIDEKQALEVKSKTLGVACYQKKWGIEMLYQTGYCNRYVYTDPSKTEQFQIDEPKYAKNTPQMPAQQTIVPKQDLAKIHKNSPQLVLENLHIYDVQKMSFFRKQNDVVMIESSTGNYAIPKHELVAAKRINFTSQLEENINSLLKP